MQPHVNTKPTLIVILGLDTKWTGSKMRILITTQLALKYFVKFTIICHVIILKKEMRTRAWP